MRLIRPRFLDKAEAWRLGSTSARRTRCNRAGPRRPLGCWSSNPRAPQRPDPLTGWAGGAETQEQVRLTFPTLEAAAAYAAREGIDAHVVPAPPQPKLKIQAYADNFR